MKLLLFGLLLIVASTTQAQVKRNAKRAAADTASAQPAGAAKEKVRAVIKELGLSKEQMKQVRALQKDGKTKKAEIKANTQLSTEAKKQALKELAKGQLEKMKGILTEEQFKKLMESRQKKEGATEMADDDME